MVYIMMVIYTSTEMQYLSFLAPPPPSLITSHTHTHTHTHICTHIYTCTHSHTHAYTHTHTFMNTHILAHTCTPILTHLHTHAHLYSHTCTHMHTYTHTCTHMHTYTHTLAHTCTPILTHLYTHAHLYSHTCTHMHTYTHTRAHTCTPIQTHVHTHTHTQDNVSTLVGPETQPHLSQLLHKPTTVKRLINSLKRVGSHFFPELGVSRFVCVTKKRSSVELETYRNMALASCGFSFRWSRWNSDVSAAKVVVAVAETNSRDDGEEVSITTTTNNFPRW